MPIKEKDIISPDYYKQCEARAMDLSGFRSDALSLFKEAQIYKTEHWYKSNVAHVLPSLNLTLTSGFDFHKSDGIEDWDLDNVYNYSCCPDKLHKIIKEMDDYMLDLKWDSMFMLGLSISSGRMFYATSKEQIIKINHLSDENLSGAHKRTVVVIPKGCSVILLEQHLPSVESLNHSILQVVIEDGASLDHYCTQDSSDGVHISQSFIKVMGSGSYKKHTLSLGAKASRDQIMVELCGEKSEAHLEGVHVTKGSRTAENVIQIRHRASNTQSSQNYKGLLFGNSQAVFQGSVVIDENNGNVDSSQESRALVLSENARMYSQPALDIFSQDVICSHGSAIGGIDKSALFYLSSRGINKKDAESIYSTGFVMDLLSNIEREDFFWLFKDMLGSVLDLRE